MTITVNLGGEPQPSRADVAGDKRIQPWFEDRHHAERSASILDLPLSTQVTMWLICEPGSRHKPDVADADQWQRAYELRMFHEARAQPSFWSRRRNQRPLRISPPIGGVSRVIPLLGLHSSLAC